MNGYPPLAVVFGGAIRAWVPAAWIAAWVGGDGLMSVVVTSAVASRLCFLQGPQSTHCRALVDLGMGPGAMLAYLPVGPGVPLLSL